MDERIIEKVKEVYKEIMDTITPIYEEFKDYYGEDRVDIQNLPECEGIIAITEVCPLSRYFPILGSFALSAEWGSLTEEEKNTFTNLGESILENPFQSLGDKIPLFLPFIKTLFYKVYPSIDILIYFPKVRVTNENDRYIDITKLWVKVSINIYGKVTSYLKMLRSEYTYGQYTGQYIHSHARPLDTSFQFSPCCLGDGPLSRTFETLQLENNLAIWKLACLEIDRYTKVESVSGGPYRRLEEVRCRNENLYEECSEFQLFPYSLPVNFPLESFLEFLIKSKVIKFNYLGDTYGIAMTFNDFRIKVSNVFIEWFNQWFINEAQPELDLHVLMTMEFIGNYKVKGGHIYSYTESSTNAVSGVEGTYLFSFKGHPITFHFLEEELEKTPTILLTSKVTNAIAKVLLLIINYRYGKLTAERLKGESDKIVRFL